jgi:hypothetical protein
LEDNDKKIGDRGGVLKPWKERNLGSDPGRSKTKERLRDMVNKQIQLHRLLLASNDASATADSRGGLQTWAKGKIDEYGA